MAAGGGSYTEHMKSYQDNWIKKKPSPHSQIGIGTGKGRHVHQRSQNGGSGGVRPKRSVSLAWEKKGLVGRWTHLKYAKFGKLIVTLRKHLVCPTPKLT